MPHEKQQQQQLLHGYRNRVGDCRKKEPFWGSHEAQLCAEMEPKANTCLPVDKSGVNLASQTNAIGPNQPASR